MDGFLAVLKSFASDYATQKMGGALGGAQGMGDMWNLMSRVGSPETAPSPHDFDPGAPAAPTPNPYASALSLLSQPSTAPPLPTAPQMGMQQPAMGNLGMPNSQMMPSPGQMRGPMGGQQLAAQAYGRYY